MKDPLDDMDLPPLVRKATEAMRKAAEAAAAEHWSRGRPIYIWRDEQVMALYGDGTCVPADEVDKENRK
jgi:hypothetical protein